MTLAQRSLCMGSKRSVSNSNPKLSHYFDKSRPSHCLLSSVENSRTIVIENYRMGEGLRIPQIGRKPRQQCHAGPTARVFVVAPLGGLLRTFSPRVPVAAGVRGPSVGNAGAAIALCCALHSNSFGLPNNQLKSFPCVFFTKEVLQSRKYIFRRGDCVFSPPSGQHPSTEGKKGSELSRSPCSGATH